MPRDVRRHQIGRELDARKAPLEGLRQSAHEERLAEPRYALDENMPAGQQRDQHLIDNRMLADQRFGDFRADRADRGQSLASELGCRVLAHTEFLGSF